MLQRGKIKMKETKTKNIIRKFLTIIILICMISAYFPAVNYTVKAAQETLTEKSDENDEVVLDETIKQCLLEQGIDTNKDGIFTKEELGSEKLRYLCINASNEDLNLSGIEYMQNLERITIHASGIKDFSFLSKLKKLKDLDIQSNDEIDCEQLKNISSLEKFSTLNSEVKNLNKLNELKKLRELSLSNAWYDIKEIENFINLENLYIYGNIYNEAPDFNKLINLKSLSLSFNLFDNINTKPLTFDKLTLLESLSISSYRDTAVDFTNISNLKNLKTLSLNAYIVNNAKNIDQISKIPNLESLNIDSWDYQTVYINVNSIANPKLKELKLAGIIDDIGALTKLNYLENVTINNRGLGKVNIEKYLNDAENIKVKNRLKLEGTFEENIEPIICGQTRNINLLENAIIKRITSKESALYNNDTISMERKVI